ncbi:DNA-binding protein [Spartinivicinus ruber]|uniref:DNA-binding protein n=1 Tax=Spartinivicinus ruber TaxID=2683272 RepID=UPI0013D1E600|nr:DNA-binding protein [Spartinivicinus ruber]
MGSTDITPEQVIETGEQLEHAGMLVTGFALRKNLKAGDPKALMEIWKRHITDRKIIDPNLTNEFVAAISTSLEQQLQKLEANFHRSYQTISQDATSAIEELEVELELANTQIEQLKHQLNQTEQQAQISLDEFSSLSTENTALIERQQQLNQQLSLTEQQTNNLRSELKQANSFIDHLKSDKTMLCQQSQQADKELNELYSQLHQEQQKSITLEHSKVSLQKQLNDLKQQLESTQQQTEANSQSTGQYQDKIQQLQVECAELKAHNTELKSQLSTSLAQQDKLLSHNQELEKQVIALVNKYRILLKQ